MWLILMEALALEQNNGKVVRGFVHDSRGNWCGGFGFRIPATSVGSNRSLGLFLRVLNGLGEKVFRKLIVQSDSKRVIDWIDGLYFDGDPQASWWEKGKTLCHTTEHPRPAGGAMAEGDGNKRLVWLGALTEVWAILKGVEWAWRKGFRKLIVQSDSKRVIDWIDGTSTPRGPICNIIEKCKSWKKNNWEISFKHIFREQNIVADTLVKHIKASNTTWVEWEEPPHSVEEALLFDLSVVPNTTVLNQNNAAPSTFKLTWEQPPDGWYVVNTDGSFGSGANNGSCAGVVRDSRGNWCGGFGFRIPATSVALTEAWAILKGVEWAWRKGFRKLIVQSDSKRVIDWIDGTSTPRGPICNIIEKCKSWKKNNWEISFKHIFREQNIVADTLVKHIKASNTTWVEWEEPPHSVEEALLFDLSVVPYERLISEERLYLDGDHKLPGGKSSQIFGCYAMPAH
nr:heat shock 70 kDa protein-like [Ipomoea batatas]